MGQPRMWWRWHSFVSIVRAFLVDFSMALLTATPWRVSPNISTAKTKMAKTNTKKGGALCSSPARNQNQNQTEKAAVEDVVVVGAGIAGLATALALHRLGVKSLVLEKSRSIRKEGTSIGVWENAWKVLDTLGVAEELRLKSMKLTQFEIFLKNGNLIKTSELKTAKRDIEFRAVERKLLLQALVEPLPVNTLKYNSEVAHISQCSQHGHLKIDLTDGSTIHTKVLVGCDGARSEIAKWMGLSEPRYTGYYGIRGVGFFPEGHKFKSSFRQIIGKGVRAGLVPITQNKVYWFVTFNSSLGPRISDTEAIRKEALGYMRGWQMDVVEAIQRSPSETLTRSAIRDRWLWPLGGVEPVKGCATLAGDALHPMTPNLGQGGCLALEDAVILARKLGEVFKKQSPLTSTSTLDQEAIIGAALKSYIDERWYRVFRLSAQSFAIGAVLQIDIEPVCSIRDAVLPLAAGSDSILSHTQFDCGPLLNS